MLPPPPPERNPAICSLPIPSKIAIILCIYVLGLNHNPASRLPLLCIFNFSIHTFLCNSKGYYGVCACVCVFMCVCVLPVFCHHAYFNHKRQVPMDSVQHGNDIMIFARNTLFRNYGVIYLPQLPPNTLESQKTDTYRISVTRTRYLYL